MSGFLNLLNGKWIDPITRLPNKEFFQQAFEELKNSVEQFYVLNVKLNFVSSNESVRNFVLSRVSSIIKHSVRIPKDFVCRLDDDEFCIVIHGISDSEVYKIANRVRESLNYLLLTYGNERIKIDCEIDIKTIGGGI